jgi:FtsP/CotA-like multicopper oxidase with cupredoxin domain
VRKRKRRGPGALLALLVLASAVVWVPSSAGGPPGKGQLREYWIAAVPMRWNVVPNGRNAIEGERFDKSETTFTTIVYRRYTEDWAKAIPNQPGSAADNDGIPGPLLRARVGDKIIVHFKNLDNEFERPHSMHFHGVHYPFGSDGAYIPGFSTRGGNVKPGDEYTYRFTAEPDSVGVWPYHDHSRSMSDSIAGGMYGAISILGRDEKPPDREFVVYFTQTLDFMTINGHAFVGNTPVFHAKVGDVVQWDVLAIGDDHHTFHVHGHRWRFPGGFQDTRTIGPAESFAVRWKEDVPGTWLYHCHVEDHMMNGMIGIYRVTR